VVRAHGYTTEMYCASCEVRTEFICYVEESRPLLWSGGQSSWLENGDVCRRKIHIQIIAITCCEKREKRKRRKKKKPEKKNRIAKSRD
jgi:hypothetical protein